MSDKDKLLAALKPFNDAAKFVPAEEPDFKIIAVVPVGPYAADYKVMGRHFTAGHLRRAAEAYAALEAQPAMADGWKAVPAEEAVGQAMLDAWNEICSDTDCHPLDLERQGRKLLFSPKHWARLTAMRLSEALSASDGVVEKMWPRPWRYDPEGYNEGPCIKDAKGQVICALFWPIHPAEETALSEQATEALGRLIAAAPSSPAMERREVLEGALKDVQGIIKNCTGMDSKEDDMLSEVDKIITAALASTPIPIDQPGKEIP